MSVQLFHVGIKALVKNDKDEYLVLQVNPAKLSGEQPAYWDIPGGRIEEEQTVKDTLEREVDEELGTKIVGEPQFFTSVVSNIKIPTDNGQVGLVLMIYMIEIDGANLVISDEHQAFEWVDRKVAAERLSHKYPKEFTEKL